MECRAPAAGGTDLAVPESGEAVRSPNVMSSRKVRCGRALPDAGTRATSGEKRWQLSHGRLAR